MNQAVKRSLLISLLVVLLAFLSFAGWNIEVRYIKGWDGLAWLQGFPFAAFFCTFFIVLAAVLPALDREKIRPGKTILAIALLYAVAMTSFVLAFLGFHFVRSIWSLNVSLAGSLLLGALLLTVIGFYIIMRRFMPPMRKLYLLCLLLAVIACLVLSNFTIGLFPVHGQDDFVHTIKAGYQQFWIAITLAIATALGKDRETA